MIKKPKYAIENPKSTSCAQFSKATLSPFIKLCYWKSLSFFASFPLVLSCNNLFLIMTKNIANFDFCVAYIKMNSIKLLFCSSSFRIQLIAFFFYNTFFFSFFNLTSRLNWCFWWNSISWYNIVDVFCLFTDINSIDLTFNECDKKQHNRKF